jgi:curved DNA-binding protein CbpA
MTHYDTLGVPADASADEIKQSFRRKASATHPDKGGSDEEMQAINQAYAVLSDPARRRNYDETGSDGGAPDPDAEATAALIDLFTVGIDRVDGNLVDFVRDQLGNAVSEGESRIRKNKDSIARLMRQRGKVKTKEGRPNLVHEIIDSKVQRLEAESKATSSAIFTARRAQELLMDFEWVGESQKMRPFDQADAVAMLFEGMFRANHWRNSGMGGGSGK